MSRLGQAIRRHRETARNQRELDRTYRMMSGTEMRTELSNLARWTR